MDYEKLSKEQLLKILKEKNLYSDFKGEIKGASTQKDLNDIFVRLNNKLASNDIIMAEFSQLKELIKEKYNYLKTEQQVKAEELAGLDFLEKFKVESVLEYDEEWRGDNIYCKKCGTARSHYWKEYERAMRIKCECQEKEAYEEREKERIATEKEKNLQKLKDLGINPNKYGFDKFKVSYDWQRQMVEKANEFLKDISKSIIFTGQSGCGKTHIFNSIVFELVEKGYNIEYLRWIEQGKYLKSIITDTNLYQPIIKRYKNTKILYIDDFLKVGKNGMPTDADISLAFEILDYRKENKLPTMISTERSLDEILKIDEAIGGRLLELCEIRLELFGKAENYRLKL